MYAGYTNASSKRNGVYYLPKNYQNEQLPVMVMLHGSAGSGSQVLHYYKALADKHRCAMLLLLPDNLLSAPLWYPPMCTCTCAQRALASPINVLIRSETCHR